MDYAFTSIRWLRSTNCYIYTSGSAHSTLSRKLSECYFLFPVLRFKKENVLKKVVTCIEFHKSVVNVNKQWCTVSSAISNVALVQN